MLSCVGWSGLTPFAAGSAPRGFVTITPGAPVPPGSPGISALPHAPTAPLAPAMGGSPFRYAPPDPAGADWADATAGHNAAMPTAAKYRALNARISPPCGEDPTVKCGGAEAVPTMEAVAHPGARPRY